MLRGPPVGLGQQLVNAGLLQVFLFVVNVNKIFFFLCNRANCVGAGLENGGGGCLRIAGCADNCCGSRGKILIKLYKSHLPIYHHGTSYRPLYRPIVTLSAVFPKVKMS